MLTHPLAIPLDLVGYQLRISPPDVGYAPAWATPQANLAINKPVSELANPVIPVKMDQARM